MPLSAAPGRAAWLSLALAASFEPAAAQPPGPAEAEAEAALPLRLRLSDEVVRQAVREAREEAGDKAGEGAGATPSGAVLSGGQYAKFARDFKEAQKPGCFGPDALKFQPAGLHTKHWNLDLGGLFALPVWATAIARGKCN